MKSVCFRAVTSLSEHLFTLLTGFQRLRLSPLCLFSQLRAHRSGLSFYWKTPVYGEDGFFYLSSLSLSLFLSLSHCAAHADFPLRFDTWMCAGFYVLHYVKKVVGGRKPCCTSALEQAPMKMNAHAATHTHTHTHTLSHLMPRRRQNVRAGCGRQMLVLLSAWRLLWCRVAAGARRA